MLHEASPVGYHSAGTMRLMLGIAHPTSKSLYSSSSNSNSNNVRVQHARTKWPLSRQVKVLDLDSPSQIVTLTDP